MTAHGHKPRYRVVPAQSGCLAPSRAFANEDATRAWAALLARRYGIQFDVWNINPATGRGPLLASFSPVTQSSLTEE